MKNFFASLLGGELPIVGEVVGIIKRLVPDKARAAELESAFRLAIAANNSRWTPQAIGGLAVLGETLWKLHQIDVGAAVVIDWTMAVRLVLLSVFWAIPPGLIADTMKLMRDTMKRSRGGG